MQSWRKQSTFHKRVVILDMSFQQVLKTGQACFTPKISLAVANAQHLKTHPSSRHELASKMESISSTLPVSRDD